MDTLWLSVIIVFGPPVVFLFIVYYVFRPSARAGYEAARHIPFTDPNEKQDGRD